MADFNVNHITGKQGQQGTVLAGVTTVSSTGSMRIPSGPTEQRGGRGRGVFGSGATPTATNVMDMIEIATTGNSTDFGDDVAKREEGYATGASSTRGVLAGGYVSPDAITNISYLTFSSGGGVSDFGDLNLKTYVQAGASDNTRMLIAGGGGDGWQRTRDIKFLTIASTGNDSQFGELIRSGDSGGTPSAEGFRYFDGFSSPTRGFSCANAPYTADIQMVTIASKGNALIWGDNTFAGAYQCGNSNSVRGSIAGGYQYPGANVENAKSYIIMASEGRAYDFGNLSTRRVGYAYGGSSQVRGFVAGGYDGTGSPHPSRKTIDSFFFESKGEIETWGDLQQGKRDGGSTTDCHGGLGGY